MNLLVEKYKALSCLIRLKIVYLLLKNPEGLFVCELSSILNSKQYNVSKHLNIMKMTMLVEEKKIGRSVLYKIKDIKENKPLFESVLNSAKYDKDGIFDFNYEKTKSIVNKKQDIKCINA